MKYTKNGGRGEGEKRSEGGIWFGYYAHHLEDISLLVDTPVRTKRQLKHDVFFCDNLQKLCNDKGSCVCGECICTAEDGFYKGPTCEDCPVFTMNLSVSSTQV